MTDYALSSLLDYSTSSTDVHDSRTATGSRKFPFLAWFFSLPRTGKALLDDCGLSLQTRSRANPPKREKFNFRLPSVAEKRLCLSSLIPLLRRPLKVMNCSFFMWRYFVTRFLWQIRYFSDPFSSLPYIIHVRTFSSIYHIECIHSIEKTLSRKRYKLWTIRLNTFLGKCSSC